MTNDINDNNSINKSLTDEDTIFTNISEFIKNVCEYYISDYYVYNTDVLSKKIENISKKKVSLLEQQLSANSLGQDKIGKTKLPYIWKKNFYLGESLKDEDKRGVDYDSIAGMIRPYSNLSIVQLIAKYNFDKGWPNCVKLMGKWYEANVHSYQSKGVGFNNQKFGQIRQEYSCPLLDGHKVWDDCSAFTSACLIMFREGKKLSIPNFMEFDSWCPTSQIFTFDLTFENNMKILGFDKIDWSIDAMKPFDIICYNVGGKGHVEIYAGKKDGKMHSWSWGSIHDGMNGHVGMPAYFCKADYRFIYRQRETSVPDIFSWS